MLGSSMLKAGNEAKETNASPEHALRALYALCHEHNGLFSHSRVSTSSTNSVWSGVFLTLHYVFHGRQ